MPQTRDYYDVLGVSRGASADDIRKAYRELARKLHPDVNKAPDAAQRFSEVQEAYDVLSDSEKRQAYDQFGAAGVGSTGPEGAHTYTWTSPGGFEGVGAEDFTSIFEEFIGGRARPSGFGFRQGRRPSERPSAAAPRADVEHAIDISFTKAALGGVEKIRIGRGGETETLEVRISAGIDTGARLRLRGKGHGSAMGGGAGDLILTVRVGSHPYFRREGLNILIDVPITIAEAALGTKVRVPLLKGSAELRVPPGTSSGRMLRIREKGVEDARGRKGDFLAVVQIAAPEHLDEQDRNALTDMARRLKNPRSEVDWADKV